MKKKNGVFKGVSEQMSQTSELCNLMYRCEVSQRDLDDLIRDNEERNLQSEKQLRVLDDLYRQLELYQEGSPEYQAAKARIDEISESIAHPKPEPARNTFRREVRNAMLGLKYGLIEIGLKLMLFVLIVVANVVALVALIHFLPTLVEWFF